MWLAATTPKIMARSSTDRARVDEDLLKMRFATGSQEMLNVPAQGVFLAPVNYWSLALA
jgi:hypothetical protein